MREREKKSMGLHVCMCAFLERENVRACVCMHMFSGLYVTRTPNTPRNRNAEHNDTVECEYLRERQYTMLRLSSTFLSVYPCICVNSFYFIYSCYQLPACACVCVCVFEQYVCVINITHAPLVLGATLKALFRDSWFNGLARILSLEQFPDLHVCYHRRLVVSDRR